MCRFNTQQLTLLGGEQTKIVNVAKVRQLSPFRYPGGKTWLVPEFLGWLQSLSYKPKYLLEPFAGGGIISLSTAYYRLAGKCIMVEKAAHGLGQSNGISAYLPFSLMLCRVDQRKNKHYRCRHVLGCNQRHPLQKIAGCLSLQQSFLYALPVCPDTSVKERLFHFPHI
jgi:hypothetical protein